MAGTRQGYRRPQRVEYLWRGDVEVGQQLGAQPGGVPALQCRDGHRHRCVAEIEQQRPGTFLTQVSRRPRHQSGCRGECGDPLLDRQRQHRALGLIGGDVFGEMPLQFVRGE
ncbi:Uncharacterised protein [Mycobacteroides abscessus subsp. abscessus]|nr:Uncharacterised protein [Mycobacteroides abscessus subsp. abscessus]